MFAKLQQKVVAAAPSVTQASYKKIQVTSLQLQVYVVVF